MKVSVGHRKRGQSSKCVLNCEPWLSVNQHTFTPWETLVYDVSRKSLESQILSPLGRNHTFWFFLCLPQTVCCLQPSIVTPCCWQASTYSSRLRHKVASSSPVSHRSNRQLLCATWGSIHSWDLSYCLFSAAFLSVSGLVQFPSIYQTGKLRHKKTTSHMIGKIR